MTQLTADELFTPQTGDQWLATILADANAQNLQTTSWQSGGMARTILQIMAPLFGQQDGLNSIIAQGNFLDFSASGVVTYTAANGTTVTAPVTPDPSIPSQNPLGIPGWLDALANSRYNVTRIGAQQASNLVAVANTSASTYGPYAIGTYHAANLSTGATYANAASLTITPSPVAGGYITAASNTGPIQITTNGGHELSTGQVVYITGVFGNTAANGFFVITVIDGFNFTLNGSSGNGAWTAGGIVYIPGLPIFNADLSGPIGSSGIGGITQPVTANSGVFVWNPLPFVGVQWESNIALAARCRAKLSSLSPNGPSGAYQFFALSANTFLQAQTPSISLTEPVTQAIVSQNYTTGTVTTYVASDFGAVTGCVQLAITGATNATPIVVATTSAHGLSTGAYVVVSGVQGNTAANNTASNQSWVITVTDGTHFSLNGSVGNESYTGGGSVEGGDLGLVDSIIQNYCVPDAVTETTASASNWDVAIVAAVTVSAAYATTYANAVQVALAAYFKALKIGGQNSGGVIQYNDVIGVLYAAGISSSGGQSNVKSISSLTINGTSGNVTFASPTSFALLSPTPVVTVTGV